MCTASTAGKWRRRSESELNIKCDDSPKRHDALHGELERASDGDCVERCLQWRAHKEDSNNMLLVATAAAKVATLHTLASSH